MQCLCHLFAINLVDSKCRTMCVINKLLQVFGSNKIVNLSVSDEWRRYYCYYHTEFIPHEFSFSLVNTFACQAFAILSINKWWLRSVKNFWEQYKTNIPRLVLVQEVGFKLRHVSRGKRQNIWKGYPILFVKNQTL